MSDIISEVVLDHSGSCYLA